MSFLIRGIAGRRLLDAEGMLYLRFEGERSISRNRFVLSQDGKRLTIHTVITADRLPAPLPFNMPYERVWVVANQ